MLCVLQGMKGKTCPVPTMQTQVSEDKQTETSKASITCTRSSRSQGQADTSNSHPEVTTQPKISAAPLESNYASTRPKIMESNSTAETTFGQTDNQSVEFRYGSTETNPDLPLSVSHGTMPPSNSSAVHINEERNTQRDRLVSNNSQNEQSANSFDMRPLQDPMFRTVNVGNQSGRERYIRVANNSGSLSGHYPMSVQDNSDLLSTATGGPMEHDENLDGTGVENQMSHLRLESGAAAAVAGSNFDETPRRDISEVMLSNEKQTGSQNGRKNSDSYNQQNQTQSSLVGAASLCPNNMIPQLSAFNSGVSHQNPESIGPASSELDFRINPVHSQRNSGTVSTLVPVPVTELENEADQESLVLPIDLPGEENNC